MKTWRLTVEYDGTRYSGWQEQRNARTVAGELRAAAEDFLGVEVELGGSGRTDAGVHAAAQVAHLRADLRRLPEPWQLLRGLNDRLPADIVVLEAEPAPNRFHARHDAVSRSYVYQISRRKTAFSKRYVWWVKEDLDIESMKAAALTLEGRHDFICFAAADPSKPGESTIVVVEHASVDEQDDLILFRIQASHFLWRMVRRLAGVLVRLGRGEITEAHFAQLLDARCDPKLDVAAWTAPAAGLFLDGVRYRS
ncbi:MAG TPA: tRNA pseudouridine(38-40) synthase TruA [Bryobacteraceae bacterium]|nr:tRNA pseudouridine(38-40) synthase TruA [Bryobacteraceae bacterium]